MKKILVSLIIFVLVFSMFPALALAAGNNIAMERIIDRNIGGSATSKTSLETGHLAVYQEQAQLGGGALTLPVPHYTQNKWYYGGAAAFEMVFDYYGPDIPQEEIAVASRTDTEYEGTFTDDMRRAAHFSDLSQSQGDDESISIWGYTARGLGYAAFVKGGMTISDLHNLIDAGYAIIVLIGYPTDPIVRNYWVVIGYDNTGEEVIVHDPWWSGGANTRVSETTFNEYWGLGFGNWGLFAHPWEVDLNVPKSIAPDSTFSVTAYVTYPCPPPFDTAWLRYRATSTEATINLPAGFSLAAGETPTKTLGDGTMDAGELESVSWEVIGPTTLGSPSTISVSAEGRVSGSVDTHGSNAGYSYTDRIGGEASDTVTARSPGTTWDLRKRLSWPWGYRPDVAVWEDNVHVVWQNGDDFDIYYRRSRDGGTTWDPKKRLSWTSTVSTDAAIAVYGSDIHVVWADLKLGHYEIFYRRSRDGGTTWDSKKRLSWTSGHGAVEPDIAAYYYNVGGTVIKWVHVVWAGGAFGEKEIYYRRSTDGGSTWDWKKKLSWTTGDSITPSVDAWTSLVAVAWQDERLDGEPYKIYLRVSLAAGGFWEPKRRVSWFTYSQHEPSVAIWGPHVHITWWGMPTLTKLWYRRNDNYGRPGGWIPVRRMDWADANAGHPSIEVHGIKNVHLVWAQWTQEPWRREIFYRSSDDGGYHWSPRKRITWITGDSQFPSVAVWGDLSQAELHLVWHDDTLGTWQIFYKKGHFVEGWMWTSYHSYSQIVSGLRPLEWSGVARLQSIGVSVEGRQIWAIKISDNPDTEETAEPDVLFVGLHHAREWISAEVPYYLAVNLVQKYHYSTQVRDLVNSHEIWIAPVLNPDGLEYSRTVDRLWRKNRRDNGDGTFGVDLNRNYGYQWGQDLEPGILDGSPNSGDDTYWGPNAFSEPETIALRDLILAHNFQAVLSYHSYSQLILYPWAYTTESAPDSSAMNSLAVEMSNLIYSVHDETYTPQQASQLYLVSGDLLDWAYETTGVPAFTIELRPESSDPGFELPKSEILATCEENWPAALYLID